MMKRLLLVGFLLCMNVGVDVYAAETAKAGIALQFDGRNLTGGGIMPCINKATGVMTSYEASFDLDVVSLLHVLVQEVKSAHSGDLLGAKKINYSLTGGVRPILTVACEKEKPFCIPIGWGTIEHRDTITTTCGKKDFTVVVRDRDVLLHALAAGTLDKERLAEVHEVEIVIDSPTGKALCYETTYKRADGTQCSEEHQGIFVPCSLTVVDELPRQIILATPDEMAAARSDQEDDKLG